MQVNSALKFDKKFFMDFWKLLKPYWTSNEKYTAALLLLFNIIFIVVSIRAQVALTVKFFQPFNDSLVSYDKALLIKSLIIFTVSISLWMFSEAAITYFHGRLAVQWRQWLTKNYLKKWLNQCNYYRMQHQVNQIDNPDQRISEDLDKFPDTTLQVFSRSFRLLLSIGSFSYVLWVASIKPFGHWQFFLPGYFFWFGLLYAGFAMLITIYLGRKLPKLDYQQQQFNANFRFALIRA